MLLTESTTGGRRRSGSAETFLTQAAGRSLSTGSGTCPHQEGLVAAACVKSELYRQPPFRRRWLRFNSAVLAVILGLGLMSPFASAAVAAEASSNATFADTAMRYVNRNGADACADSGLGRDPGGYPGGECKQFVNCIVLIATGGKVQLGGGYYSPYEKAGGRRVSLAEAAKGDIIQLNGPELESAYGPGWAGSYNRRLPIHTAIVIANLGNGSYRVVDSNYENDGIVREHTWNPSQQAEVGGYGVNIWRLGSTSPAPPSASLPRIVETTTYQEGSLVYVSARFSGDATGFGFRGANGAGWAEESHSFANPSYGRVQPGRVDYPFNHACGTSQQYESDVEFWVYNGADKRSGSAVVHLACSSSPPPPPGGGTQPPPPPGFVCLGPTPENCQPNP
jgi:hypothetical protein